MAQQITATIKYLLTAEDDDETTIDEIENVSNFDDALKKAMDSMQDTANRFENTYACSVLMVVADIQNFDAEVLQDEDNTQIGNYLEDAKAMVMQKDTFIVRVNLSVEEVANTIIVHDHGFKCPDNFADWASIQHGRDAVCSKFDGGAMWQHASLSLCEDIMETTDDDNDYVSLSIATNDDEDGGYCHVYGYRPLRSGDPEFKE